MSAHPPTDPSESRNTAPGADRAPGTDAAPGTDPGQTAKPGSFMEQLAQQMASRTKVAPGENGQIDVLASVGGVRGIVESVLPALLFLTFYVITSNLVLSLVVSVGVALILSVIRIIARDPFMQAIGSLIGVAICALVAQRTGSASGYFVPGFIMSGGTALVLFASAALRWPLLGVAFGFIRSEGLHWRTEPSRLRSYTLATLLFGVLMLLRLVVQIPLYLAGNVSALGVARLVMGVPLYALGLWIAWIITKPRSTQTESAAK